MENTTTEKVGFFKKIANFWKKSYFNKFVTIICFTIVIQIILVISMQIFNPEGWKKMQEEARQQQAQEEMGRIANYAIIGCEKAIKNQLKAPSTAKFSKMSSKYSSDGSGQVVGILEAKNEFGVPLQKGVTCTFKITNGDYTIGAAIIME